MRFSKILLLGFVFLAAILFSGTLSAQDSIAPPNSGQEVFTDDESFEEERDTIVKLSFEKGFQNKYQSDEFNYEVKKHKPTIWDRFKSWLADFFRRLFNFGSTETSASFVSILLRLIAVVIILVVIYLIVKAIMNKDGQWIFGRNSDKRVIRYDEIEKNLRITDFEKLIHEAMQSGQKRLSIRYYYLWLLKQMAEKQHIEWDPEKTNSDYFNEITDIRIKQEFGYLSYLYNNIWYGEFDIDDMTLEKAKITFENTIRSL